jgi:putative hydrolases of HD superfamily
MTRLEQQLAFAIEIDKLKEVLRQTRLLTNERRENSAEHSWHIALLAILLAEYASEPMDVLHVVKMLLIHDLVEIDAGDTFAYSAEPRAEQALREGLAAQRIFGLLPADQQTEFLALWDEFEASLTAEARFANALDRFMPFLHNFHGNGGTWRLFDVRYEQVLERMDPVRTGSPMLWDVVQALLDRAVEQGLLPTPQTE